jgi:oligoribonuclease
MNGELVWIDLEMTGLNVERHSILEIASLVTDKDLNVIEEGPDIAISQTEEILAAMDGWSADHHSQSGLLDRAANSPYDTKAAEKATLEFIKGHCAEGESPLCGNSVWQDRRFLARYMPELEGFLHYRLVDVSSVKELAKRWYPELPPFEKKKFHLALSDIRESIEELRYYRERIFIRPQQL